MKINYLLQFYVGENEIIVNLTKELESLYNQWIVGSEIINSSKTQIKKLNKVLTFLRK